MSGAEIVIKKFTRSHEKKEYVRQLKKHKIKY